MVEYFRHGCRWNQAPKRSKFLFKIYFENGFCYSEESSWKALQQVKNLVEALPLTLSGPTGKTEWNNWPEVMQKRIKWACCHSKIFVELPILFQVRRGYFNSFRMMTQITGIMNFMQEFFFCNKRKVSSPLAKDEFLCISFHSIPCFKQCCFSLPSFFFKKSGQ